MNRQEREAKETDKTVAGIIAAEEKPSKATLAELIGKLTLADAKAYEATDAKTVFCLDYLGLSIEWRGAEGWVNKMEDRLDALLEAR